LRSAATQIASLRFSALSPKYQNVVIANEVKRSQPRS
jgi:hypothetical protein